MTPGGNIISVAVNATTGSNIIFVAVGATSGGNIISVAFIDTCFPVSISSMFKYWFYIPIIGYRAIELLCYVAD